MGEKHGRIINHNSRPLFLFIILELNSFISTLQSSRIFCNFYLYKMHFISFFIFFNALFHTKAGAQNVSEPFQNCSKTFNCGNIGNIGYPFWGSTRPKYCGHPEFEINCTNQTANIKIDELNYRVLSIDNFSKNLKVVREDHIGDICPEPYVNITLDGEVLSYASDVEELSIYYGCPSSSTSVAKVISEGQTSYHTAFSCNGSDGFYVTPTGVLGADDLTTSCTTMVLVPTTLSAIQTSNYPSISFEEMLVALDQGFGLQWNVNNSVCQTCSDSGGVCGFNSSFTCHCSSGAHNQSFSCLPAQHESGARNNKLRARNNKLLRIIVPIGVCSALAMITIASLGCYYRFTRKRQLEDNVETFITNYHTLMPQRYSYSDIKKMTNSFAHKLGQGGFGGVYRGNLSDGRPVAVKLLLKSIGDGEEFINEVASISRTSHVNVVTLLGFCYQNTNRALVYEYMPNGSLDKFIYRQNDENICHLVQKTLFEIAIGIARGLEYLHRGCNTRIVHFDIKPHNILLDDDMCPKISDFGLAKLCKGKESIVSMLGARGTAGYIAPEVFMRGYGGASYKSDVYSYGMMILEMFAGKDTVGNEGTQTNSESYFPDYIYKYLERGETDENMILDDEEEMVRRKMIKVGFWCIQTNPANRPSMTKVIDMLEGSIELLHIPPKPVLFSPTNCAEFSSSRSIYPQSQLDEEDILPLYAARGVSMGSSPRRPPRASSLSRPQTF